jgi:hypothetical protein
MSDRRLRVGRLARAPKMCDGLAEELYPHHAMTDKIAEELYDN